MIRRTHISLALAAVASLALPAAASAGQRWVSPTASSGATTCISTVPCTLATAVAGAVAGDEIIVMAGRYTVDAPLGLNVAASLHGEEGHPRPIVTGAANLASSTLTASAGARVSYLELRATASAQDAATLKDGVKADRLILRSESGDGAKVTAAAAATTLTNTLAVTNATGAGSAALKLRGNAAATSVVVRNVTAYTQSSTAAAIRCETTGGSTTTIVNTVARGGEYDLDATKNGVLCAIDHSFLRTARSPGLAGLLDVLAIDERDPALDAALEPAATSPLVDAGVDHADNGTLDLTGRTRTYGARTDIGAVEYNPGAREDILPAETAGQQPGDQAGTTTKTPAPPRTTDPLPFAPQDASDTPELPPAAPPRLGRTVLLDTGKGEVLVRIPGAGRFVPLSDASGLPVGTVVDARKGAVTLESALPGDRRQSGTFGGGMFQVRQPARAGGMVDILLEGGDSSICTARGARARKATAVAARARRSSKRKIRSLWARDKGGRFRTHGRNSVATVRGTRWLTVDRCDGTLTKVTQGAVDVRDKRRGTVKRVKAGRKLLVRR